jgi:hypothetical protein
VLAAMTAIYASGALIFATHRMELPGIKVLWQFEFALILIVWLRGDRRSRAFAAPYEFDAFLFWGWQVAVPYYLYRTRGRRGILLGVAVWGLYIFPAFVWSVVDVARR